MKDFLKKASSRVAEFSQEILQCLPALVKEFEKDKEEKKAKGKKGKKKATAVTSDTKMTSSRNEDCKGENALLDHKCDKERFVNSSLANCMSHMFVSQDANEMPTEIHQSSKVVYSTQNLQLAKKPSLTCQTVGAKSTMADENNEDLENEVACLADSFSCIELVSQRSPCIDEKITEEIHTPSHNDGSVKILPLRERLQRRAIMNKGDNLEGISARKASREGNKSVGDVSASVKTIEKDNDKYAYDLNIIPDQNELKRFSSKAPDVDVKLREASRREVSEFEVSEFEVSEEIAQVTQEFDFPTFCNGIRNWENDHFIAENSTKSLHTSADSGSKKSKISPLKENAIDVNRQEDSPKQEAETLETPANEVEFYPGDFDSPFSIKQACNGSQCSINNDDTNLAIAANEFGSSYEVASLTSDSLGCLLNDSVVLFDSPFQENDPQSNNKENSMIPERTPDGEKYVEMLRKRFGIMLQNTPLNSQTRFRESSPKSAQSEKAIGDIPLTLMERLRKRSQKM
eukprot:Seg1647.1 transcript_id=Seg1647.1/GoldUCD/mRNA.D3Y31 product="hypothetical protein" protein_id=Seg1647.1/GoldUCD/D3Y31